MTVNNALRGGAAALGICALAALSAPRAVAHDTINIAVADWTGPVVVCGIVERIVTGEMGMKVNRTPLPGSILRKSIRKSRSSYAT